MSDSHIKFKVKEGDRNALVSGSDNVFAKVGKGYNLKESRHEDSKINTKAEPNKVYKVTSALAAKELFGENSPLHKSCLLHFALGGAPLYCVMPENTVGKVVSGITKTGDASSGTLTISNTSDTLQMSGDYIIEITKEGNAGGSKYRYSNDGGESWSSIKLLTGTIVVDEISISTSGTFAKGDSFKFTITGNKYDNDSLKGALESLKDNNEIRVIQLVDPSEKDMWTTLDIFLTTMAQNKRWIRGIVSMADVANDSDINTHIEGLKSLSEEYHSKNIAIFYQYARSKVLGENVSVANHALATLSKAKVQESIGWTGAFPQEDVVEIKDWDTIRLHHSALSDKGLNSLYYEDGEAAGKYPFFGIGLLKSPPKSDFRKISSGRVMDKALRVVHSAVFPFLRSNQGSSKLVAGSKAGILNLKLKMETALDGMVGRDEVNGYEINIPAIDDPSMTVAELASLIVKGNLEGEFKLYENSHIESMAFDAMYAMPKL